MTVASKAFSPNLFVYKSSAGSGKTTQIVIEYLRIIIPNPKAYKNILAITFTNKATEEMKNRIIESLEKIATSDGPDEDISHYISDLMNDGLDFPTIKQNAFSALKYILHDYSHFAISTIDSLMHRIIRAFSYEFRLSNSFEVVLDQNIVLKKSVDEMINSLSPEQRITDFIVTFIERQIANGKTYHIEKSLYDTSKVLLEDDVDSLLPLLQSTSIDEFADAEKKISQFISDFENTVITQAKKGLKLMDQVEISSFFFGEKGAYSYFNKLAKITVYTGKKDLFPTASAQKFFSGESLFSGKAPNEDQIKIEAIAPQLTQIYNNINPYIEENIKKYFTLSLIRENIHATALLFEISGWLEKIKIENDYVFISDFNKKLSEQMNQGNAVPFIYERIGEKFLHSFIDEFQDTSVLQWHNLLPLITNGLSYNKINMIVGDGKQSIYRWRGGELEQFDMLPTILKKERMTNGDEYETTLKNNYHPLLLNKNYRSGKNIVLFNNEFFEYLKIHYDEALGSIYSEHKQESFKKNEGIVSIAFFENGREKENRQQILEKLHKTICDCLSAGYMMSDIAILCRDKKDGMKASEYLIQKGIPIVSSDSLLIGKSKKLHFIMAVLKIIANPEDEESIITAYSYLRYRKENDTDFHQQLMDESVLPRLSTSERKIENTPLSFLNINGFNLNTNWQNQTLYEIVEQIINSFDLIPSFDPFLSTFLDEAHQQKYQNDTGIPPFISWWEKNKTEKSVSMSDSLNAVRTLTIHKSKGLEFPVVICFSVIKSSTKTDSKLFKTLPSASLDQIPVSYISLKKKTADSDYENEYNKEIGNRFVDEVNTTYVAFTRPKERLYILQERGKTLSDGIIFHLNEYIKSLKGYNPDTNSVCIGDESGVKKQPTKPSHKESSISLADIPNKKWINKITISEEAPLWMDSNNVQKETVPTKVQYGELIHQILSKIHYSTDIPHVLTQFVNNGYIDNSQYGNIEKMLTNITHHQKLAPLFNQQGTKIYNELSILTGGQTILRPDRIVILENKYHIVEYKTGQKETQHISQLQEYGRAIQSMGHPVEQMLLTYIDPHGEIEISEVSLETPSQHNK